MSRLYSPVHSWATVYTSDYRGTPSWARSVAASSGRNFTWGALGNYKLLGDITEAQHKAVEIAGRDLAKRTLWSVLQGNRTSHGLGGEGNFKGTPMWGGVYAQGWHIRVDGREGDSHRSDYDTRSDRIEALYSAMYHDPSVSDAAKSFYIAKDYFPSDALRAYTQSKGLGLLPLDLDGSRQYISNRIVRREKIDALAPSRRDLRDSHETSFSFSVQNDEKFKAKRIRRENLPMTSTSRVEWQLEKLAVTWAAKVSNTIKRDLAKLGAK